VVPEDQHKRQLRDFLASDARVAASFGFSVRRKGIPDDIENYVEERCGGTCDAYGVLRLQSKLVLVGQHDPLRPIPEELIASFIAARRAGLRSKTPQGVVVATGAAVLAFESYLINLSESQASDVPIYSVTHQYLAAWIDNGEISSLTLGVPGGESVGYQPPMNYWGWVNNG